MGANATSPTQVTLTWSSNTTGELGTKIERSTDGVNFTLLGTLGYAGATSYTDNTAAAGTTYTYRVWTYTSTTNSGYSNTATVATPAAVAPANLAGTVVSSSRIDLSWGDYSNNETGFKVERSTDGVNFTEIGTAAARPYNYGYGISYQATGLTAGTLYYFRVRATNALGNSAYSNVLLRRTSTTPAVPTNSTATPAGTDRINLAWTDLSTNEQGFKIERSTDGVNYTLLHHGRRQSDHHLGGGSTPGTTYSFRVRAITGTNPRIRPPPLPPRSPTPPWWYRRRR